jgi:two-component system, response regulator
MDTTERSVRILLAEDNAGDVFLVRRALEKHGLKSDLTIAKNGEDAMQLLREAESAAPDGLPELILLDLNLPRVDGQQILAHIRSIGNFSAIPVIILTSSESSRDRDSAICLGANRFFHKPTDLQSFMELGKVVQETLDNFRPQV